MKILIVEDDERVADALAGFLGRAGYAVERAGDGRAALEMLGTDTEAVILDLGLPDVDGIDLCRRIRAVSGVPILIATARSQVHERIRGLRAGADDFLVKPYDVQELLARIEAVTRRTQAIPGEVGPVGIDIDGVRIDLVARRVLVDGEQVELTRKEFDIVAVLARYPGVAVPRERLIREVWNTDWQSFARSLEVHVASIRRKLGRPALIETVRGVGYRLTGL
ncbi:response regulator transcription factor [Microbacterium azadirachtae]|jgi:DNA-binding response OmpR family regulator|uniref:Sensory transduction protein RegX3 n=1 Tax=Microbacterium azadirachtae TaxID=582680 RepID=A0A0F0KZ62_9MICO|nr:response regulator transcription factor [Microbacterium azadirachtae]KJL26172.1 Response regulator ArlR [Microbacterium azadirachtae]UXW87112.1 response regulator transcription factor [Microbacterium azadirachtae]SDM25322.1 DNA-binding response regulator, OmpR family, contains REC and winged-helix (wHTH) domain [Microbacterium azadirachtae]SEG49108.1 DNA-binding response regulator, OmpR family, contains REC and winged-helix (wHTH) domain [Microbacterium azadirachtae]SEG50828.1 DNA-binding r